MESCIFVAASCDHHCLIHLEDRDTEPLIQQGYYPLSAGKQRFMSPGVVIQDTSSYYSNSLSGTCLYLLFFGAYVTIQYVSLLEPSEWRLGIGTHTSVIINNIFIPRG